MSDNAPTDSTIVGQTTIDALLRGETVQHGHLLLIPASDIFNSDTKTGLRWAVEKWESEVANRPLRNIHRRSHDTTWRQVIRYFGGDDEALCGPRHDDLIEQSPGQ